MKNCGAHFTLNKESQDIWNLGYRQISQMTYQPKREGKMADFETFIGNPIENSQGTNVTLGKASIFAHQKFISLYWKIVLHTLF